MTCRRKLCECVGLLTNTFRLVSKSQGDNTIHLLGKMDQNGTKLSETNKTGMSDYAASKWYEVKINETNSLSCFFERVSIPVIKTTYVLPQGQREDCLLRHGNLSPNDVHNLDMKRYGSLRHLC